jgi:phosphate transport system substrate-binding protein
MVQEKIMTQTCNWCKLATAALLALASFAPMSASAQILGAGATFPAPIYTKWFAEFKLQTGKTVDYQAVGSGAGYNAIKTKTVDFGASDAPLSAAEEAAMPGPVIHIPTVGGAVVLSYNLPGIGSGLQFTPEVIGGIFLGKIKTWNDPRIRAANPGKNLPDVAIQPVHRTDGSGTTYIFTNYLKKADSDWAAGPGAGKSVNWPNGLGGKGNQGVEALVRRTPGAVGYVELAYAITQKMAYGNVRNRAGKFIEPTVASTSAAINAYASELAHDIKTPTVDAKGADSYPICSVTYIIVYKGPGPKNGDITSLWSWAMSPKVQAEATSLFYAPLPPALVKINLANMKAIPGSAVK